MRIIVKAKAGSKEEKVERITQPTLGLGDKNEPVAYKVSVKALAMSGLANQAIVKALAAYFEIPPARIQLVMGAKSKQKIFDVL